tara:strand:- start:3558 stop:4034 length:477 start_codon:yes stop_codon:yes gene_type:complete
MILSKKTIFFFFIIKLFLLNSCGFESIYSVKNTNFRFGEVKTNNQRISSILEKKLTNYISNDNNKTSYNIEIKLFQNKVIKSRNKKGEPLVYSIVIKGEILIFKNIDLAYTLGVNKFFDYQNTDNKFDLSEYEESIQNNLVSNIQNDLIIIIVDMQND